MVINGVGAPDHAPEKHSSTPISSRSTITLEHHLSIRKVKKSCKRVTSNWVYNTHRLCSVDVSSLFTKNSYRCHLGTIIRSSSTINAKTSLSRHHRLRYHGIIGHRPTFMLFYNIIIDRKWSSVQSLSCL
jgi:hypothetical protein